MSSLDDLFDGEEVLGGLFDLDGSGSVSLEEALLADEWFLQKPQAPASPLSGPDDLENEALELGLGPTDYDSEEALLAALEEERGW